MRDTGQTLYEMHEMGQGFVGLRRGDSLIGLELVKREADTEAG
jgi:hypothetical protein